MIKRFDPVIYPFILWIALDCDLNYIQTHFNDFDNKEIKNLEDDVANLLAFTMPVSPKEDTKYGVIIYFRHRDDITFGLVAHESSHAAKYLFDFIGADVKEHEPFEFLIEWIANCCAEIKDTY